MPIRWDKFTVKSQEAIQRANELASEHGNPELLPVHLLGALLEEGCPTRFYLPMPAALEPNIAAIYQRMGLTQTAIRTIATARPQRDVYYACTELGQRLFHLPLGELALACLARNTARDHALMDDLRAAEGPEGFAAAWLRTHSFEKEATYVNTWHERDRLAAAATADR